MQANHRDIIKHSAVYGLGQILTRFASFLLLPIYTHYLSPADYGVIAVLDVTIALLGVVIAPGIVAAVTRFHFDAENERERDAIWWTGMTFIAAMATGILMPFWLLREPIAEMFIGSAYTDGPLYVGLLLATAWCSMLGQLANCYLRVRKWSGMSVGIALGGLGINIGVNVTFLVSGWGIGGILIGNLIVNVIMAGVRVAFLVGSRGGYRFHRPIAVTLWKFGSPFIVTGLLSLGMHQADRYFLRLYSDFHDVGIYSVAYAIGQSVSAVVLMSFTSIWSVVVYEVAKRPDAKKVYATVFEYATYAMLLAVLALALFAGPLLRLMSTPEFAPAAVLIPIIGLAYVFFSLHEHFKVPALIAKRTVRLLPAYFLGFAVNVAGNILLIPYFGSAGAAWCTVVTFIIFSFSGLVVYRRVDKIPYPFARLFCVMGLMILTFIVFDQVFGNVGVSWASVGVGAILWCGWSVALFGRLGLRWLRQRKREHMQAALDPITSL